MPRNPEFSCGSCFFSYVCGPSSYEFLECQYEAHRSVENVDSLLPRVHRTDCVCPKWRHSITYKDIAETVSSQLNTYVDGK